VIEVFYIPDCYGVIKRHRFYSNEFPKLTDKYSPTFVLQFDHVYPINMYLYYWFKKKNTQVITIQIGREAMNWDADYGARKAFAISRKKIKYPVLPYRLLSIVYQIQGEVLFLLDHYFLPFIFLRILFYPVLKIYSGKVFKKNSENYHDYYLMYKINEKKITEKEMGNRNKIVLIQHPLETIGKECNNVLYHLDVEKDRITIFPSYGLVDILCAQKAINQNETKELVLRKWSEIIEVIHNKLSDWEMIFKLHPNAKQDLLWQTMLKEIKTNHPYLVVLDESEKAEKLILKSKIVISDVSTVLWWTSFLRDKLPISLDLFGYPGGDDMKVYDDVCYISSMDKLEKIDLVIELNKRIKKADNNLISKDSLTSFLFTFVMT
jgi:hypothetical protein